MGEDFCEDIFHFGEKHKEIYRITNVAKLRTFQYKLLQRAIITNTTLYQWKMVESKNCSLCNQEEETVIHLFIECNQVQQLWKQLQTYLQDTFQTVQIVLSKKGIILNEISEPSHKGVNFICLLTKQFIYRQRCLKQTMNFLTLKTYIQRVKTIECYIAKKNNKLGIHTKKWTGLNNRTLDSDIQQYALRYVESMEE